MEDQEELRASVGDPFDDVPLEQLAGAIMAQFARRDIMVFNADVIELSRKPINFKETNGGIILKNKKYSFDQGTQLHVQDVVQSLPEGVMPHEVGHTRQALPSAEPVPYDEEVLAEHQVAVPVAKRPPTPRLPGKAPLRYEIYDPEKILAQEAAKRGLKFSIGQRYPIYQESVGAHGYFDYVTADDDGHQRTIASAHFQPETEGELIGGFKQDNSFGGEPMHAPAVGVSAEMMQVPDLRSR